MAFEHDPIFGEHVVFMANAARKLARGHSSGDLDRMVDGMEYAAKSITQEMRDLYIANVDPLSVMSTYPANEAVDVAATDTIVVGFNHAVAQHLGATIIASIAFSGIANDATEVNDVTFVGHDMIITLNQPMVESGEVVTVTVSKYGATDARLGVLEIDADYEFSFTLATA